MRSQRKLFGNKPAGSTRIIQGCIWRSDFGAAFGQPGAIRGSGKAAVSSKL